MDTHMTTWTSRHLTKAVALVTAECALGRPTGMPHIGVPVMRFILRALVLATGSLVVACGLLPVDDAAYDAIDMGAFLNRAPSGTLVGRVIDAKTREGIAYAAVHLEGPSPAIEVITDESGAFELHASPVGHQRLAIAKPGYIYSGGAESLSVDVQANTTIQLAPIEMNLVATPAPSTEPGGPGPIPSGTSPQKE